MPGVKDDGRMVVVVWALRDRLFPVSLHRVLLGPVVSEGESRLGI